MPMSKQERADFDALERAVTLLEARVRMLQEQIGKLAVVKAEPAPTIELKAPALPSLDELFANSYREQVQLTANQPKNAGLGLSLAASALSII